MKDNFHKNNHFVPKFYLKNWESSPKKIWTYRTLVSHENVPLWNEVSRESIAYHPHLYTKVVSGEENDDLENLFQKEYEVPAEEPIKKAITDAKLTESDWFHLVRFLAIQDLRTPANLIEVTKRQENTYQKILDETVLSSIKKLEAGEVIKTNTKEEDNNYTKHFPGKVHIDKNTGMIQAKAIVGRSSWLFSVYHLLSKTTDILHKHKWTIMKPFKGMSWFTSDKPVMKLNYTNSNNYDFKGGYFVENGEIFMPLSPYHMMYTRMGARPPQKGSSFSEEQTLKIRQMYAENSLRMIFSDRNDSSVSNLRTRVVDSTAYQKEKEMWENWNTEQSKLEKSLDSNFTIGTCQPHMDTLLVNQHAFRS